MTIRFALLVLLFFSVKTSAQTLEVSGTIFDSRTNKPLEFVTVKVADTTYGTMADKHGKFFIRLSSGANRLIFSCIGYNSDTIFYYVEDKNIERNVFLKPSEIMTEAIEVYGEDPAYEIVRKAIRYKKEFQKNLVEYEYDAYSKFVIRSNRSEIPGSKIGTDTSGKKKMGIFGILESETKGYFKRPDLEKQIVKSKRETANIARGFALPLIVNFYDESVDFNEFRIPTPLSDNAFDKYEFKLIGTTSIDSIPIFKIKVINSTETKPLFNGVIYIADSIFSLMRVDLTTNDAAKPLGIRKIEFKQKFASYDDSRSKNTFWMPTDVEIFAEGSFVGLIKFEAEVFTIVSHYDLNKKAPPGTFDDVLVKINPDALKDSSYWKKNQLIKNTSEERRAYNVIEAQDKKRSRSLNIGLTSIAYGKYLSTNPLEYYRYNRVEGSALNFNLKYRGRLSRTTADGYFQYGISDKKSKYELNFSRRFLNDRRLVVNVSFYDRLQPLFYGDVFNLSILFNTLKALFDKKDNFDYYYAKGYDIGLNYRIIPQLRIGAILHQQLQRSAYKNTDFSIRKKDVPFIANPQINDAFLRMLRFELRIDPNKFRTIDWGDGDISRFRITNFPMLTLGFRYSGKDFLKSSYEYRRFSADITGQNYFSSFFNIRYRTGGAIMTGQVPYQSLAYFNSVTGTIDFFTIFRAMQYNEFLGDKLFYFSLENNFGKLLWGNIPFIKNFNLIGFFAAGRTDISKENYEFAAFKNFSITKGLYMETGFGISRILDLFRVDFAWRLNNPYKGKTWFFVNLTGDTF